MLIKVTTSLQCIIMASFIAISVIGALCASNLSCMAAKLKLSNAQTRGTGSREGETVSFIAPVTTVTPTVTPTTPPSDQKYLLLYQSPTPTIDYIADNIAEVDALPFDGIFIEFPSYFMAEGASVVPVSQFVSEFARLKTAQAQLQKVKRNFVEVKVVHRYGSFDERGANVIQNFANLAEAARDAGLEGIVYDNESYESDMWNLSLLCPGESLTVCKQRSFDQGRLAMEAMIAKWPNIVVFALNGAVMSDGPTYQEYMEAPQDRFELLGSHALGMSVATLGTQATYVDGGEQEFFRSSETAIANGYNIRKNVFPTRSTFLTSQQRMDWPSKISIANAFYDEGGACISTGAQKWQNDLTLRIKYSDKYAWAFPFYHVFIGPLPSSCGKVRADQSWFDATAAGRQAAGLPAFPN